MPNTPLQQELINWLTSEDQAEVDKALKMLKEKLWLSEGLLTGADLSGLDLSGLDLSDAKLQNANLQRAKLKDTRLQQANLDGSDLGNADLTNAKLQRANLIQADFSGASFSNWTSLPDEEMVFGQIKLICGAIPTPAIPNFMGQNGRKRAHRVIWSGITEKRGVKVRLFY